MIDCEAHFTILNNQINTKKYPFLVLIDCKVTGITLAIKQH